MDTAAGLVYVCLSASTGSLKEYLGDVLTYLKEPLGNEVLEVFHYHQAIINTNWKLWQDNNSEAYHNVLHVLNRRTGSVSPAALDRRRKLFANGHALLGRDGVPHDYEAGGRDERDQHRLPGLGVNEMVHCTIFPDTLVLFRATVLLIHRMVPLGPGRTLVEWRGLGLKSDNDEVRAMRLRHHNQYWGPAGRNLPEDIMAVEGQWQNMNTGVIRYSIFAREEELRAQDDGNVRHYYQQWGRLMERNPARPLDEAPKGASQAIA